MEFPDSLALGCVLLTERYVHVFFFFQAEDGIRDLTVTGVQTCALPISLRVLMPKSCKSPAPRPAPPLSSTVSPLAPRPSKRTSRAATSTKQERPWARASRDRKSVV